MYSTRDHHEHSGTLDVFSWRCTSSLNSDTKVITTLTSPNGRLTASTAYAHFISRGELYLAARFGCINVALTNIAAGRKNDALRPRRHPLIENTTSIAGTNTATKYAATTQPTVRVRERHVALSPHAPHARSSNRCVSALDLSIMMERDSRIGNTTIG